MPLPTKVSESVRRLNPQLFGQTGQKGASAAIAEQIGPEIKPRIRQHKGDGMNNWEREFAAILATKWPGAAVSIHREVSLPLANGLRYKVDFVLAIKHDVFSSVYAYEVKGVARAAGIAKLKMAATIYPWMCFFLVTKRRKRDGGGWAEEHVHP